MHCSVEETSYVELGASGGGSLGDVFYLNTFNAREYIRSIGRGRVPITRRLDRTETL
jgi:hypothetical protein